MTTRWRTTLKAAAGVAVTAIVVTACGSSKSGSATGSATPLAAPSSAVASSSASSASPASISAVASSPALASSSAPPAGASGTTGELKTTTGKVGTYLTDGTGRTLYLFAADTSSASTCTGQCATVWSPLVTSAPATASGGASASLLGTTMRADGTTQVTYAGHPLYYFAKDTAAGMTAGQGATAFGARWWLVTPAGKAITAAAAAVKPAPSTTPPKPSTVTVSPSPSAPSLPSPSY